MNYLRRPFFTTLLICSFGAASLGSAQSRGKAVSVERVALVGSEQGMGVEISGNMPLHADTRALSGPDRIVIDFPGALPTREVRGFVTNQGGIQRVRVGVFQHNPPVTRVVLDLEKATEYQLITSGNAVLLKLAGPGKPAVTATPVNSATATPPPAPPPPPLRVTFQNGLLSISAEKANLADVLFQVHEKTGADIPIPSGAEQEQVVIQAGPGPAKDVMAALLNGSRFNFILQGTTKDPNGLGRVLLTPKDNIGFEPAREATPQPMPQATFQAPGQVVTNQPLQPEMPPEGEGNNPPPTDPDTLQPPPQDQPQQ